MKKIFCGALALLLACMSAVSCGDKNSGNSEPVSVSVGENGVGELITPDEDSEEYSLGSYRLNENGIKLYYDDETIPAELMNALANYFTSFQNKDFESYKNCLASDYFERYNKYLEENMNYSIDNSFDIQCENIRSYMLEEIYGSYDYENTENYTGDFKITRIRGERIQLAEDETEESLVKNFFSYLDEIFDMDYYSYVFEQADNFEYLTFFIIAEGEDGEEHRIISEVDIVFAEKDGKYYTFG